MSIHIYQGIIPIEPTSKSSMNEDKNYMWLSKICKPIDHYSVKKGDPKITHKPHKYSPIVLGSIYRKDNTLPCNVSYSRIYDENIIHDPLNYEILHKAEIKDNQVFLNGQCIAIAPTNKTKSFKDKFCKSVVWSLMNDDQCLKDKLQDIGYDSFDAVKSILKTIKITPGYRSIIGWHKIGHVSIIQELRCAA